MKIKKYFALSIAGMALLANNALAQKETNWWHFGSAYVNFNTTTPSAGPLTSGFNSSTSASSISNANGDLLLYEDGKHVYAANGTSLMTLASFPAQSVIVPKPGTNSYYVFTSREAPRTIRYSTLDFNGTTFVPYIQNALMPSQSPSDCEPMTVVKRCDGNYWLITHQYASRNFKAYLITNQGFSNPVISAVGAERQYKYDQHSRGTMKVSPNGRMIATATPGLGVELFNFDPSSGIVSYKKSVNSNTSLSYWGVEFSQDNGYLFFTVSSPLANSGLYKHSINAIPSTVTKISGNVGGWYSDIRLKENPNGNGKIYVAKNGLTHLDAVESPNTGGTYATNSILLGTGVCGLNLPNLVSVNTPSNCSKASFKFAYEENAHHTESSLYGPMEVYTICKNNIWIDASASTNQNGLFLRVQPFDLTSWSADLTSSNGGADLYNNWKCTASTTDNFPSCIYNVPFNLNTYIYNNSTNPIHQSLVSGQLYLVGISVGPDWNTDFKFVRPLDCLMPPKGDGGILDGLPEGITRYLNLFPNPANGILNIEKTVPDALTNIEVSITGALGNVIKTTTLRENELLTMDVSNLFPGLYYVKYTLDGVEKHQMFRVE